MPHCVSARVQSSRVEYRWWRDFVQRARATPPQTWQLGGLQFNDNVFTITPLYWREREGGPASQWWSEESNNRSNHEPGTCLTFWNGFLQMITQDDDALSCSEREMWVHTGSAGYWLKIICLDDDGGPANNLCQPVNERNGFSSNSSPRGDWLAAFAAQQQQQDEEMSTISAAAATPITAGEMSLHQLWTTAAAVGKFACVCWTVELETCLTL